MLVSVDITIRAPVDVAHLTLKASTTDLALHRGCKPGMAAGPENTSASIVDGWLKLPKGGSDLSDKALLQDNINEIMRHAVDVLEGTPSQEEYEQQYQSLRLTYDICT